MNNILLLELWKQAGTTQLVIVAISGLIVGAVYFGSMRWSIAHLAQTNHKIALYTGVALLRIILFFGVLVMVADRNIAVILVYLLAFFISRMLAIAIDRKHFFNAKEDKGDS